MKGCGPGVEPHIEWMTTEDKTADKAKGIVEKVVDKAEELAKKVIDAGADTIEAARNKVGNKTKDAGETIVDAGDKAKP
jgi:hypothetical protein